MQNELLQDLENHFETLNHIRNLAQNYDERLLDYLLEQSIYKDEFKSRFFITRKNALIFKLNDFLTFLDLRNLSGSFTSYANKIGLSFKTKGFLKTNNEVVLNFAFKDGVIKGGQSKDDETQNEIFFNEILAKDEIDILFAKKALHSFELIGNGDLKENLKNANLLIKGNNLLALHSLKKKFANKVKLIYIDPPYNTGNDSFNYNDRFNHSTWLSFMKNRLEVAREFLSDDGVIFIQLDYNEVHYCKILCDEIFGRENFVNEIIWRRKQATSYGKNKFGITNDSILMYSKTENYNFYPIYSLEDENTQRYIKERFIFDDNDGKGKYMKSPLVNSLYRPNLKYVFCGINPPKNGWLYSKEKMQELYDNQELIIPKDENSRIYRKIYLSNYKGQVIQNIWLDIPIVNPMAKEQIDFDTQKPEALIQRILQSITQENDLVMDFFAGSGTTLAVAHKMQRQYIGIEQMDYIETITKERLKKVCEGEQGGISKNVEWSGGGSFVYAELMPLNAIYKEKIQNSNNEKELESMYKDLESKAFLDYRVDLQNILKDKEFRELDLENKKEVLKLILDSNMDYVLYGDIQDKDYAISKETIELNKIFYGDENV
ncbi:site-specific DNA-methyltransferase [Campylobacter insulaenigrae]|uniref:site-specific DNA-methyltransferase n=1 Tax=Campylobacter insulaenigrae TaxID=260714 RepID=UPI00215287F4|nr:site-specific DNA-methyltransferase [Campylobacter insulaenigrae]MCR6576683.1 site-specific DNA-methyltransferase [Campylobacter insulaenigrae]MCR6578679.1 site-specific DNA-methyltransferase [Campylobacter insulaenigrae]